MKHLLPYSSNKPSARSAHDITNARNTKVNSNINALPPPRQSSARGSSPGQARKPTDATSNLAHSPTAPLQAPQDIRILRTDRFEVVQTSNHNHVCIPPFVLSHGGCTATRGDAEADDSFTNNLHRLVPVYWY